MKHTAILAAVLLVLVPVMLVAPPSAAVPADSSIAFASNPTTSFHQSAGTAQGVTSDGTLLYVTTSSTFARYDTNGSQGCIINTSSDGSGGTNGAPAYHDALIYVPRFTGTGSSAQGNVAMYGTSCIYTGEIRLGSGAVDGISYHRGSFYVLWRNVATGDSYLKQYDESWNLVNSWFLDNYLEGNAYPGPNGIAWYGDFIVIPLHANGGGSYGVEVWQFPGGTTGPVKRFTTAYPSWTNAGNGRNEVGSQGIYIVDDFDDGASTPYAWVVGRNALTGNGDGNGGIARFDLTVFLGTHAWTSAPVTYGALQQVHDMDDHSPQGIAVDDQYVYALQSWEIERWTHSGNFVGLRNTSSDIPGLRLGGGTVEGDFLYIAGSNWPDFPRQSWILKYRTSDLVLVDSKSAYGGEGEGAGIGFFGSSLMYLVDRGFTGELWLQRYNPDTLNFESETYLGHYPGIYHQGIEVIGSGSTQWIYAPHHDPDDPYGRPGIHHWKSTDTGSTWTYQATSDYTSWINPDDLGGRAEINSQDMEFGCVDSTPYAWSAGRRATDGGGHGAWVRHSVNDPLGLVDCTGAAGSSVSVSTSAHTNTGASSGSVWSFNAAPGATNALSSNYLKVTNAGDAAGSILVDLGPSFTGPNGGTISTSNNVVFLHAKATTPSNVVSWASINGGASASATIPVPANCDVWIQYRITALPGILPDGSYSASLAVSPQN